MVDRKPMAAMIAVVIVCAPWLAVAGTLYTTLKLVSRLVGRKS